jgi:hypothetical protein
MLLPLAISQLAKLLRNTPMIPMNEWNLSGAYIKNNKIFKFQEPEADKIFQSLAMLYVPWFR